MAKAAQMRDVKGPSLGRPVTDDGGRAGFGRDRGSSSKVVVGLLVAASLVVITVDAASGDSSPIDPARAVVGNVIGPVESATATAVRPFRETFDYFSSNDRLREDVAELSAQNSKLRSQVEQAPLDRNRLAELDGLTNTANQTGYALVAARVVGMGPMQSFSRTVTIDAGTTSGVRQDMTVLNNDGLVGRVISATRSTANVLLVLDTDSVVGGRLGSNNEIGFLRGRGVTGDRGRLSLDLVDHSVTPAKGDIVVTWGSENGVPYVAGIPIGKVESVYSTPRELAKHAVIDPYVDFTSLDVVGVVVPRKTKGDRLVINGQGEDPMNLSRTGARRRPRRLRGDPPDRRVQPVLRQRCGPQPRAARRGRRGHRPRPAFGATVGFLAGMLLDLAPPADHVAGRWALAFVLIAVLAGRVRDDARRSPLAGLATVAVCSFVATSVFALSGVVLGDHALPAGEMMQVICIALLWDVVMAPLLLPVLMMLFERTRPAELAY